MRTTWQDIQAAESKVNIMLRRVCEKYGIPAPLDGVTLRVDSNALGYKLEVTDMGRVGGQDVSGYGSVFHVLGITSDRLPAREMYRMLQGIEGMAHFLIQSEGLNERVQYSREQGGNK